MKYTSEMLMKAMGLSVGDRVKIDGRIYTINHLYDLQCFDNIRQEAKYDIMNITYLVRDEVEYEILPRPKRVGDMKCGSFECAKCHLRCLPHCNQMSNAKKTLFNILDGWNEYDTFDQEIHDLLKARLDKEVKE